MLEESWMHLIDVFEVLKPCKLNLEDALFLNVNATSVNSNTNKNITLKLRYL